jgi:hypothetical protein
MKRIHIGLIGRERDKQDGIVEKKNCHLPQNGEKSCPTVGLLEQIQDYDLVQSFVTWLLPPDTKLRQRRDGSSHVN